MSDPVTTVDYVRAAISGDAIKAKEYFDQLMAAKVVDVVDTTRHEIAQNYFGHAPEVEDETEEEATEQDIEANSEVSDDDSENSETDKNKEEPANENA